jgi:hypothetical protein
MDHSAIAVLTKLNIRHTNTPAGTTELISVLHTVSLSILRRAKGKNSGEYWDYSTPSVSAPIVKTPKAMVIVLHSKSEAAPVLDFTIHDDAHAGDPCFGVK